MKKELVIFVSIASLIFGCDANKSDIQQEYIHKGENNPNLDSLSLHSGIKDDSLSLNCYFGMTKNDFIIEMESMQDKGLIEIQKEGPILSKSSTENYEYIRYTTYEYQNNSLWRSATYINPSQINKLKDTKKTFLEEYKEKITSGMNNVEPHENGRQDSKYFWLNGNKRLDLFDSFEGQNIYALVSTDLSQEKAAFKEQQKIQKQKDLEEKEKDEAVFQKLKDIANRDWPNDYSTQEYWINQQKQDYYFMKQISNDDPLKVKAQKDWPYDFSTQKYWYQEQLEAKQRLQ